MATQRSGKGSSEAKKNGSVKDNGSTSSADESTIKKIRQSHKARVLKEQKDSKLRWLLVGLLLVVAVVGLYCYLWYTQTEDMPQPSKKQSGPQDGAQRDKPKTDKQKPAKQKQEAPKKANKEKATSQKGSEGKAKGKKKTASEALKEAEIERLERVQNRVLRQPIPGGDPDRPHIMDILTGDNLLMAGNYQEALERFNAILSSFPQSPRAQFGKGLVLSHMAREKKSNKLLETAIDFFRLAGLDSILATDDVRIASLAAMIDHSQQVGKRGLAIRGMEKLAEMRPDDITYANQLGMLYLDQGKMWKAKAQFKKAVEKFEDNNFGRAQLGFVLYQERHYEQALPLLLEGIRLDKQIRENGFFYNYAGDCLVRLNRTEEAFALYGEAVALGLFPSMWQRSLSNEPGLRAQPWWSADDTGYLTDITRIEKSMADIAREAKAILDTQKNVFTSSSSNQKDSPHFILFSKGKKDLKNCRRVPKTCALLETFPEAAGCKRGTVKFSVFPPNAHVAPHVGGTNTKLQVLVALDMDPEGRLKMRMGEEIKLMAGGQIGVVDESFEQEVWYLGDQPAIYLTVDVWHPDLSQEARKRLTR